jgi:nitrogen-specific signal transduction histidine kinase
MANQIRQLIEELIPGIAHKSNNLLMNISGRIKLVHGTNRPEEEVNAMLRSMETSCEQIQSLLDKLVTIVKNQPCTEDNFDVLSCLEETMDDLPAAIQPHVQLQNGLTEPTFTLFGERERFQRSFAFFAESLITTHPDPGDVIIALDTETPQESIYWKRQRETGKKWLHIAITLPADTPSIHEPREYFFDPSRPFDPASCYLAAMENIILSHKGKIVYSSEQQLQIHIYLPQSPHLVEDNPH